METGPGKDQQQLPLTSAIAKQQSSFMGNPFGDPLSQTIDKEMGTGPKTLAQRFIPSSCQAVLKALILFPWIDTPVKKTSLTLGI
jgi:hypothetical protein